MKQRVELLITLGLQKWQVYTKQRVSFWREVDVSCKLQKLIVGLLLLSDARCPGEIVLSDKPAVLSKKQTIRKQFLMINNPRITVFLSPSPTCHLPEDKTKQHEAVWVSCRPCPFHHLLVSMYSLDLLVLTGFICCFPQFLSSAYFPPTDWNAVSVLLSCLTHNN